VTYQEILDQIADAASKCNVDLTDHPISPYPLAVDRFQELCDKHGIYFWWDNEKQSIIAKKTP
jgi:hypothetical protein